LAEIKITRKNKFFNILKIKNIFFIFSAKDLCYTVVIDMFDLEKGKYK